MALKIDGLFSDTPLKRPIKNRPGILIRLAFLQKYTPPFSVERRTCFENGHLATQKAIKVPMWKSSEVCRQSLYFFLTVYLLSTSLSSKKVQCRSKRPSQYSADLSNQLSTALFQEVPSVDSSSTSSIETSACALKSASTGSKTLSHPSSSSA